MTLIGIAVGVVASLGLSCLIAGMLYGVSATDPLTFAVVVALMFAVALLACWIPARRAMRVDDPHVRIKIGNNLYDGTLIHITDPAVVAAVLQAESKKYRGLRVPANGSLQVFHMVQNSAPVTASSD